MIRAALELLGETSLDRLTTRQIAKRVGMSQPGLFRHFRSRDAILLAVVEETRVEMAARMEAVVRQSDDLSEQLRGLASTLLDQARRSPGLSRLWFGRAPEGRTALAIALASLLASQRTLVAELVREAKQKGQVRHDVSPERVGTAFVGMVHGTILQSQAAGVDPPGSAEGDALVSLLQRGLRPSAEAEEAAPPETAPDPAPDAPVDHTIAHLDVRPFLAQGLDPLDHIKTALGRLGDGDVLQLEAPFRPGPLLALLERRGHLAVCRELASDHHAVLVVLGGSPEPVDLRDLPAPEPLERVLEETADLAPGVTWLARTPAVPRLLVPHLEGSGLSCALATEPDGTGLVLVWKLA